jgi:tetratricopeptide (TPR) repeat protein
MPSSGTSDIPHVTVHDHYIRKPKKEEVKTGALKGLRCITNPNPDILTETKAYISYYEKFESNPLYLKIAEDKAKQLKEKELLHLQTLIHLNYVKFDYKAIIKLVSNKNDLKESWSNYRISKAYEKEGQLKKAIEWMQLVVEKESQNLDFLVQYAGLLIKDKQTTKAVKVLKEHNTLYSKSAEAHALLGYAHLLEGKLSDAKKSLILSLSLDPDLLFALEYLKQLYQTTGEKESELQIDNRIQKLKSRVKIKQ